MFVCMAGSGYMMNNHSYLIHNISYFNCNLTFLFGFRTGRAVRFILSRGDDMVIIGGRHPFTAKYKVSATRIQ